MRKPYLITIDDQMEFNLLPDDPETFQIVKQSGDTWHVLFHNKIYRIRILEDEFTAGEYRIMVNNKVRKAHVKTPLQQEINQVISSTSTQQVHSDIKAPMPGLVLDIAVVEGTRVKEGDKLLVLEAMKMENIIKSPCDGVIRAIRISEGQAVDKGQLMLEIN